MSIYVPSLTEVDDRGQERASSFDRALACAFVRVENERKKEKGFLFRQPGEEISFLVQVLWPFVFAETKSNSRIVFDALGLMKKQFQDGETTKSSEFSSQLEKCVPALIGRSDFHKKLEIFASYFKDFDKKATHEIAGCFSEAEKAKDIMNSSHLAGFQEIKEALYLPISVDSKKANESVFLLSELRKKADEDIETFNKELLSLDSILSQWHEQIHDEMEQKRLPYDVKIQEISPGIKKRINEIEKAKRKKLSQLEPEISRIKNELPQLKEFERIHEAEESKARDYAKEAARNVDQAAEDIREAEQELSVEQQQYGEDPGEESFRSTKISWLGIRISHARNRLTRAENTYSDAKQAEYECESATREATEKVDDAEKSIKDKQSEYEDIENECLKKIDDEENKITSLEEERDAFIDSLNLESQDLTTKAETIRRDINELVKRKRKLISEIDSNDIPFPLSSLRQGIEVYAYIPFFLAMLSNNTANRFVVFSPARLRKEKRTAERLMGFILGKVPMLTVQREQTLSSFAHVLNNLLQTNYQIRKEICEKAKELNLLNLPHTKKVLLKGIDSFLSEGILNDKMAQKLKSSFPIKTSQRVYIATEKLLKNAWYACQKCGTYIALDIDHCPVCGTKLPGRK